MFFLTGKSHVAVGIVPTDFANKSSESALSAYPIAIANCKENGSVYKFDLGIGWSLYSLSCFDSLKADS